MSTLRAHFASAGDTKPGIAATEKRQSTAEITSGAEQEKTHPLAQQTALRTQEQRRPAEKKDGERNTKPLATTYN